MTAYNVMKSKPTEPGAPQEAARRAGDLCRHSAHALCGTRLTITGACANVQAGNYSAGMLYAFWLVKGLAIPRAAKQGASLPDARVLGYSLALTLEEKLELVQLLLLQERELDWCGSLAPKNNEEPTVACDPIAFN